MLQFGPAMLWIKTLHIIAMVSWFAGMFYLPRIFVYHADQPSGPVHDQFVVMERKLYRVIMTPAMISTILFGATLAFLQWDYLSGQGWFWVKLALVAGLIEFHRACGRMVRAFAAGTNERPGTFYRKFNEIPTVGLILVVFLVVVRPF